MPRTPRPAAAALLAVTAVLPTAPARATTWTYSRVVTTPRVWRPNEVVLSDNGRVLVEVGNLDAPGTGTSTTSDPAQVVAYDLQTKKATLVSTGLDGKPVTAYTAKVSVSADGRYVVYESAASNLVTQDTNGSTDVFVYDLKTRRTLRAGLDAAGKELPRGAYDGGISPDGTQATFTSCSKVTLPVDGAACSIYVRNLRTGRIVTLAPNGKGGVSFANTARFGAGTSRYVTFTAPGSSKITPDSTDDYHSRGYVYDLTKRTVVRVPDAAVTVQGMTTQEEFANVTVDRTGTWVASRQQSYLPQSIGIDDLRYVLTNLATGATVKLGDAAVPAFCCAPPPVFSGDGTTVVYGVAETDAAGNRFDAVYRRTLKTGAVERLSVAATQPCASDTGCSHPTTTMVATGRTSNRVFVLTALRQTSDDTDGWPDVYLAAM